MRATVVLDPRSPGGTAAAAAKELLVLSSKLRLRVAALDTRMFANRPQNKELDKTIAHLGLEVVTGADAIRDDILILHNPAFLKFEKTELPRMNADCAIIVCHENFVSPQGHENFDIDHCLELIDGALLARSSYLAPVSEYNRTSISQWAGNNEMPFDVTDGIWPNICDFPILPPTNAPRDRRGRHSRAGAEKFGTSESMLAQFPASAEYCGILGSDSFPPDGVPAHWDVIKFGGMDVDMFLGQIDFFVYFTNDHWRESFGRVIAEAIAAGKLVLTDPGTASTFGDGVIGCAPGDVDGIIAKYIADPAAYVSQVKKAQDSLLAFSPDAYLQNVTSILGNAGVKI